MGLFGKKPVVSASEADLIMTAMILAVAADGSIDDAERSAIVGIAGQIREFEGKDLSQLYSKAVDYIIKNGYEAAISRVSTTSDTIKDKAFISACECAFSSGGVESDEQELLEKMAKDLSIDEALGEAVIKVCEAKYR